MFKTTVLFTWAKSLIYALLTALSTRPATALTAGINVHLFQSPATPSPDAQISDYTEANYSGYAAQALTLAGPVTEGLSVTEAVVGTVNFIATSATPFVQNSIYGYYLTDTANTLYYGAERFPQAVPIAEAGNFITLNVALPVKSVQSV